MPHVDDPTNEAYADLFDPAIDAVSGLPGEWVAVSEYAFAAFVFVAIHLYLFAFMMAFFLAVTAMRNAAKRRQHRTVA